MALKKSEMFRLWIISGITLNLGYLFVFLERGVADSVALQLALALIAIMLPIQTYHAMALGDKEYLEVLRHKRPKMYPQLIVALPLFIQMVIVTSLVLYHFGAEYSFVFYISIGFVIFLFDRDTSLSEEFQSLNQSALDNEAVKTSPISQEKPFGL